MATKTGHEASKRRWALGGVRCPIVGADEIDDKAGGDDTNKVGAQAAEPNDDDDDDDDDETQDDGGTAAADDGDDMEAAEESGLDAEAGADSSAVTCVW